MFDADYFLKGLKEQVSHVDGNPVVRLILHSGNEFFVRDVVQTRDGSVMLNVYNSLGSGPIVASSSDELTSDELTIVGSPVGYHPVAIAFEAIAQVEVGTTTDTSRPRIGFHLTPETSR